MIYIDLHLHWFYLEKKQTILTNQLIDESLRDRANIVYHFIFCWNRVNSTKTLHWHNCISIKILLNILHIFVKENNAIAHWFCNTATLDNHEKKTMVCDLVNNCVHIFHSVLIVFHKQYLKLFPKTAYIKNSLKCSLTLIKSLS